MKIKLMPFSLRAEEHSRCGFDKSKRFLFSKERDKVTGKTTITIPYFPCFSSYQEHLGGFWIWYRRLEITHKNGCVKYSVHMLQQKDILSVWWPKYDVLFRTNHLKVVMNGNTKWHVPLTVYDHLARIWKGKYQ